MQAIRERNVSGLSHIPEDRHKHGLVLEFDLAENLALQTYFSKDLQR
jgi:general nucleoside transport system ATP-binding protein